MSQVSLRPKWVPILTYLLYSCAGMSFLILPSEGLKDLLGPVGFIMWNFLLSFGGISALVGVWLKSTSIEQIGLPGVIVGLFVYSCYIFQQATNSESSTGILLGFGCILAASAMGLVGRLFEVRSLSRINARIGRRIREERGK